MYAQFKGTQSRSISKIQWHPNNGQAPDTRALLSLAEHLEWEVTTWNSKLTEDEHFLACNSTALKKMTNVHCTSESTTKPSPLILMSYKWEGNTPFSHIFQAHSVKIHDFITDYTVTKYRLWCLSRHPPDCTCRTVSSDWQSSTKTSEWTHMCILVEY